MKREIDQAKSAAAALRDVNLSLEGELAGLADRETALKNDLREQKEESSRVSNEVCFSSILYLVVSKLPLVLFFFHVRRLPAYPCFCVCASVLI